MEKIYISDENKIRFIFSMPNCASLSSDIYQKMYLYLVQDDIDNKNLDLTQMSIHHFDIECNSRSERKKYIVNQTDAIKLIKFE